MTDTRHLRAQGVKHAELRRQIAEAFGLDDDDEALRDTVEGESDFLDLCAAALREAKTREAMAEGLKRLLADMDRRKARLEHSAKQIRSVVAEAMLNAGEHKLTMPDMTASVRMGKRRLIIDDANLPDRFKIPVTTFKTNRDAVQEAVDHGDVPDGVTIANAQPVLTIRGG